MIRPPLDSTAETPDLTITPLYVLMAEEGLAFVVAIPQVWDPETQALFAAVMSFWFGQRALAKARGK